MSGRLKVLNCVCKSFIHVDDQTVNRAFRETEYQIGADNQTLNFPNLETLGSWCPSDLESIHLSKLLSAKECHRDPVTQTDAPSSRREPGLPFEPGAQTSPSPWRSSSEAPPTPLPLMLSFRVTSRGHSSRWTSGMASQCLMSTSAPWKMGSNTSITMWAFSEWPCRWTTVWGLTAPSCTYM